MLCYPCRCLCFGVLQITRITRFLLITLQRTQIFFTDGLTFMTLDFRYFKTSDAGQFFLWKDRTDSSQPSRDLLATNECNALVSFLKYARGFHARCRVEREKSFWQCFCHFPVHTNHVLSISHTFFYCALISGGYFSNKTKTKVNIFPKQTNPRS